MEWVNIILNGAILVAFGALVLFIKSFLPSYMDEKGKNLATKEDIKEITQKTEEVRMEFKENFSLFSLDVQFKYDFYFKQCTELYSKAYAIVIQSEYVRKFFMLYENKECSFEEYPFFEIATHKTTQTLKIEEGKQLAVESGQIDIETPVSEFNKIQLCEHIISKGEYATQKLLKIAVAYRFANHLYGGNGESKYNIGVSNDTANDEELRLIREMVCCIVTEYNYFRKELKMEYDETELTTGIPQL